MKKIIACLLFLTLILSACNSPSVTNELSSEPLRDTEEPTSTAVSVIEEMYAEMLPWQIEAFEESEENFNSTTVINPSAVSSATQNNARMYLSDKGRLAELYEDLFSTPFSPQEDTEEQAKLLDNFHEYMYTWFIRRDNISMLKTEEYNGSFYSLVPVYVMDSGVALNLVKSNADQEIVMHSAGEFQTSFGFIANIGYLDDITVLYGIIDKEHLTGDNYDDRVPTDFHFIEITAATGGTYVYEVNSPGPVLIFLDAGIEVSECWMLDENRNKAQREPVGINNVSFYYNE